MSAEAPYGSWPSPITSAALVAEVVGVSDVHMGLEGMAWKEGRPAEKGRSTVVLRGPDGRLQELTPAPWNVRTRAQEYGGRSFLLHQGTLYFSHFADQRLYRAQPGGAPQPITPDVACAALRYADACITPDGRFLFAVREDHRAQGEAITTLVRVNATGDTEGGTVVAQGCDFYMAPRLSPDGTQLAWMQWHHPHMPWDETELMLAPVLADGSLGPAQQVAAGPGEAVVQPLWSPAGALHMVSDRNGWWNLYRLESGVWHGLCPMEAEFATPPWQFGMASYGFDAQGGMACAWQHEGRMRLSRLDAAGGSLHTYELPFQWFGSVQVHGDELLCVAGSPWQEMSVMHLHLRTGAHQVLKRGAAHGAEPGFTSVPQAISYAGSGGHTTHALYYPPTNAQAHAPVGEKPPLLVLSHGGPTACASPVYRPALQYWTSRGFAVLDVNYGGSTGYGRAYRERLKGQWGVVDVEDCARGARHLAEQGLVDGRRLIIRGGSAGGFTTLAALTFTEVFAAGASLYGIGDLEALARDTHKFESRYLDSLIGPWPQAAALYRARSPIHHTAQLRCPIILFQGSEDLAVPPAQSRQMHAAVKAKGLPVAYIEFEGEGHGFRQAANIRRAIDAEAYFYAQVFGFELADAVEPVGIDNLPP